MADLLPLLRQSIDWFESLVREQEIMSKVRSSELEIGLSSNDGPVEAGSDTAVSAPWEDRAFNALDEVCGLDTDTLSRFKDRFQFPDRVRIRLPGEVEWACHFFPRGVCFYEAAFLYGLRCHEAAKPLQHCSQATYAQFVEDSRQPNGDMIGHYKR